MSRAAASVLQMNKSTAPVFMIPPRICSLSAFFIFTYEFTHPVFGTHPQIGFAAGKRFRSGAGWDGVGVPWHVEALKQLAAQMISFMLHQLCCNYGWLETA